MVRLSAPLQARRLLALLHLFTNDTRIPLSAVAKAIGATEEETAADLELLACCGISEDANDLVPVFVDEGSVIIFGALPALDRPVRLSAGEARALSLALQQAGIEAGDPVLEKLDAVSAVGEISHEELESVIKAGSPEVRDRLMQVSAAISDRTLLAIEYLRTGDEEPGRRVVEPMELVQERGCWYLEAFCRSAGALRTFRIDRIRSVEALAEQFTTRELAPNGAAFVSDGLPEAVVRLTPGEEFDARQWPGARMIEQEADGSLLVSVPYGGTGWIARQVAARLGGATVLEPAEVREAVAAVARADAQRLA